jgi:hypothetical protein
MNELKIDWLKENCQMIHYFGLGFIQVKLKDGRRMHFYTEALPPITPEEDIHNHRYDFTSKILSGDFQQELFHIVEGDTHLREQETCKEGVCADAPATPCSIALASRHIYHAGCQYFISHETFHRVKSLYQTITLIERSDYKKKLAEVIRPVGSQKVCPFSQKVKEEELWDIIHWMLVL